ncbi:acyltransferase [Weissella confusa]|uniref:acyltransferase n=1 Tax=Weissella confusa TaxID=1583 RepID=UPI002A762658|nr:acyltransferase [Weissella confusa]MDY2522485.1 acyltransferase [Weissella confusa]
MKRNIGLDIAKISAMFSVILIHNLLAGGVLEYKGLTNVQFLSIWVLENMGIVAVNIFALTTGYLMVNRKINFRRVWNVVVQASFWASVMAAILVLSSAMTVTKYQLLRSVLAVPLGQYWYVNAYIGMMLMAPFVNAGFEKFSKNMMSKILSVVVVISVTIGYVGNFFLHDGYSSMWLLTLYALGGYIKLYVDTKKYTDSVTLGISTLMVVLSTFFDFCIFSIKHVAVIEMFTSYVSPFAVIQSLGMFIFFLNVKVKSERIFKIISFTSSLTFGAYLIDNSLFFYFLDKKLLWVVSFNPVMMIVIILGISLGLFAVFMLMEYVRIWAFNKIKMDQLWGGIYDFLSKKLTNVLVKF